ncbi:MAG: energy transducer TonB [Bacteroidota bacterium]
MRGILALAMCINTFWLYAQTDFVELEANDDYQSVISMPNLPSQNLVWPKYFNGKSGLDKHLNNLITSSTEAKENDLKGTVVLSYSITLDGKVDDIRATSSTPDVLNQIVIKALNNSCPWIPGKKNGEYVKMKLSVSYSFE